jgi:23S rRNA (uracil1939-C5)-methyltransferase
MRVSNFADGGAVVTIGRLGLRGEGLPVDRAQGAVPFTLPGERVKVASAPGETSVTEILEPSPDRVPPVCPHFGACGGCALQHWRDGPYLEWKKSLVAAELEKAGIAYPPFDIASYPVPSRRRVSLTADMEGGRVFLGYRQARSHALVAIDVCPILTPTLQASIGPLRQALATIGISRGSWRIALTEVANGIDCAIEVASGQASPPHIVGAFADTPFIRVGANGETVLLRDTPVCRMGKVQVPLPPGAFLQAVEACERDLARFARDVLSDALKPKAQVCDLFAGLGAFAFPLAELYAVTAVEGDRLATAALEQAAKSTVGIRPVTALRRDLFRNPLSAMELKPFKAAVCDPPFQGAEAQMQALAGSKVELVVSVSCNPQTFARDARHLTAAGFKLTQLRAFDQFRFSPNIEIAAAFTR